MKCAIEHLKKYLLFNLFIQKFCRYVSWLCTEWLPSPDMRKQSVKAVYSAWFCIGQLPLFILIICIYSEAALRCHLKITRQSGTKVCMFYFFLFFSCNADYPKLTDFKK
uniref:Uncharacterized protein n=1 Tax=Anguilla anguilla TaxID=7936 RepID=A0A0E9W8T8_ANGAN